MNYRWMRFRLASLVCLCLALATAAWAQFPPVASAPPSDKDCKKAARIVEKGKPAKKEESAFQTIVLCSADVGPAGAAAIRSMRAETDTTVLEATWGELAGVVDGTLLGAYVDVLQDDSASVQARAFSALGLLALESEGTMSVKYSDLTGVGSDCQAWYIPAARARLASPLPPGHTQIARSALGAVSTAAGTPTPVAKASACVLTHILSTP